MYRVELAGRALSGMPLQSMVQSDKLVIVHAPRTMRKTIPGAHLINTAASARCMHAASRPQPF